MRLIKEPSPLDVGCALLLVELDTRRHELTTEEDVKRVKGQKPQSDGSLTVGIIFGSAISLLIWFAIFVFVKWIAG